MPEQAPNPLVSLMAPWRPWAGPGLHSEPLLVRRYFLSTYCVLGTRLGARDVEINKTESLPLPPRRSTAPPPGEEARVRTHTSKLIREVFLKTTRAMKLSDGELSATGERKRRRCFTHPQSGVLCVPLEGASREKVWLGLSTSISAFNVPDPGTGCRRQERVSASSSPSNQAGLATWSAGLKRGVWVLVLPTETRCDGGAALWLELSAPHSKQRMWGAWGSPGPGGCENPPSDRQESWT